MGKVLGSKVFRRFIEYVVPVLAVACYAVLFYKWFEAMKHIPTHEEVLKSVINSFMNESAVTNQTFALLNLTANLFRAETVIAKDLIFMSLITVVNTIFIIILMLREPRSEA